MHTKSALYGIAFGCPKLNRDSDCPLLEIEHLSFKEKLDWINDLCDEKKEFFLRHHSVCTKKNKTREITHKI